MTARSLDIIMALGAALALLLGGFAGFAKECDEIPSEVLRLHIPANSDSPRDQEIKLALRDCVLQEYGTQLSGASSREEAADTVRGLLPEIEKTCCEFLSQQGVDYGAKAELTEMYFPTRRYEQATLPGGVPGAAHNPRQRGRSQLVVRDVPGDVHSAGFAARGYSEYTAGGFHREPCGIPVRGLRVL